MPDFLNVDQVLGHLTLREDMQAAEFGCGSAVFAMTLAKKLTKGIVYALDIQEEKLSALKSKASLEKITNIKTILCDLEAPSGSTLGASSLDIVLIPNVLFQSEQKDAIVTEGIRILKQGGQLLIVDWLEGSSFGPKSGTVKPEQLKGITEKLGVRFTQEFAAGDYHYALLFVK